MHYGVEEHLLYGAVDLVGQHDLHDLLIEQGSRFVIMDKLRLGLEGMTNLGSDVNYYHGETVFRGFKRNGEGSTDLVVFVRSVGRCVVLVVVLHDELVGINLIVL